MPMDTKEIIASVRLCARCFELRDRERNYRYWVTKLYFASEGSGGYLFWRLYKKYPFYLSQAYIDNNVVAEPRSVGNERVSLAQARWCLSRAELHHLTSHGFKFA